jgi:hypothetical protein
MSICDGYKVEMGRILILAVMCRETGPRPRDYLDDLEGGWLPSAYFRGKCPEVSVRRRTDAGNEER